MQQFKDNNQFKSFMKKESKRLGINIHNTYTTYISRRLLEKMSIINPYAFLIKGSAAETIYLGRMIRAIVDLDIASLNSYDENISNLEFLLREYDFDQFNYELNKDVERSRTGIYKLSMVAKYGKIKQHIGIDYQDKYNRLIELERRIMPPLFDGDTPFEVYLPSFEEFLAEKLCIIAENDSEFSLNTRVKDFYDIYELHGGKYDYDKLTEYFQKMLKLRNKIDMKDVKTTYFDEKYIEERQKLWDATKKRYDFIDHEIDFDRSVYYTRAVLREQLQRNGQRMEENKSLVKSNK